MFEEVGKRFDLKKSNSFTRSFDYKHLVPKYLERVICSMFNTFKFLAYSETLYPMTMMKVEND